MTAKPKPILTAADLAAIRRIVAQELAKLPTRPSRGGGGCG